MAVEKWVAGAVATYTAAMGGSDPNSIVSGNAILSTTQLDNSTALDMFADFSISLGSVTTGAANPFIGLYVVPLNEDGTTYGDGRFSSSAAGPPSQAYFAGQIPCAPSTTAVITGTLRQVLLPPSKFKLIIYNFAGVTLAASANVVDWKTYNRSVA
jgi:hypothetical protein